MTDIECETDVMEESRESKTKNFQGKDDFICYFFKKKNRINDQHLLIPMMKMTIKFIVKVLQKNENDHHH